MLDVQFWEIEIGISCAQRIASFQKSGGGDLSMTVLSMLHIFSMASGCASVRLI
jgi:hypothetical protein